MSISRFFLKQLFALTIVSSLIVSVHTSQAGIIQTLASIPRKKYVQMPLQTAGLIYCHIKSQHNDENLGYLYDKKSSTAHIYRSMRNIYRFGAFMCLRELYNTYYRVDAKPAESTQNSASTESVSEKPVINSPAAANNQATNTTDISTQTPDKAPDNSSDTSATSNAPVSESSRWQRITGAANRACQSVQNRFSGEKSAKVAGVLRFARKWGWIGARAGFVIQWPFSECDVEDCGENATGCIHCWVGLVVFGMAIQSLYDQYYGNTSNSAHNTAAPTVTEISPVVTPSTVVAPTPISEQKADVAVTAVSETVIKSDSEQSPSTSTATAVTVNQ